MYYICHVPLLDGAFNGHGLAEINTVYYNCHVPLPDSAFGGHGCAGINTMYYNIVIFLFQMVPLMVMDVLGFLPGIPGLFVSALFSASLRYIISSNIYIYVFL